MSALRLGLVTCLPLIAVTVVGCSDRVVQSSTRLTILAVNPSVGRAALHPRPATCRRAVVHASDPRFAGAGRLTADVIGDGQRDTAYVVFHRRAARECRFLLVVKNAAHTYATYLRQPDLDANWPTLDSPHLNVAAPVDSVRGDEIVVSLGGGAATTSVGLYSIHGRRLIRLLIPKAFTPNTFNYGGSLAGSISLDCVGPLHGLVAETGSANHGGRFYDVGRTLYRADGRSFRFVSQRSYRHLTIQQARARFPELRGGRAFHSCR